MRLFIFEEFSNRHIFDLNGDVYSPDLKDALLESMIVGTLVKQRMFESVDDSHILSTYKKQKKMSQFDKQYERKFDQIKSLLLAYSDKQHRLDAIMRVCKKELKFINKAGQIKRYKLSHYVIYELLKSRLDINIIEDIVTYYSPKNNYNPYKIRDYYEEQEDGSLHFAINFDHHEVTDDDFDFIDIEVSLIPERIAYLEKEIKDLRRQINRLEKITNLLDIFVCRKYVLYKQNDIIRLKQLFDIDMSEYVKHAEEISECNEPWSEYLFLRITKIVPFCVGTRKRLKFYGQVTENLRYPNSRCSAKMEDNLSFYTKNILFVPYELNYERFHNYLAKFFIMKSRMWAYNSPTVTNWSGVLYDPVVWKFIQKGNTVRVQLKTTTDVSWGTLQYFRVIDIDKKNNDIIYGLALDHYMTIEEEQVPIYKVNMDKYLKHTTKPVQCMTIHKFLRNSVTEIPDWEENDNIKFIQKFKNKENKGFSITGYHGDSGGYTDLTVE